MDYISREAAISEFETCGAVFVYGKKVCKAIVSRLNVIPAADVVEVVHGEWIDDKSTIVGDIIERNCSICGQRMTSCIERLMSYCPNCGARMDGGDHDA